MKKRKIVEHSEGFYKKAFDKYQKGVISKGETPILNYNAFKNAYDVEKIINGTKGDITSKIVREEVYHLEYQSSRKLASALKEEGYKTSFADLRKMSNADLKTRYGDVLSKAYNERLALGDTKGVAALYITDNFFGGSPK